MYLKQHVCFGFFGWPTALVLALCSLCERPLRASGQHNVVMGGNIVLIPQRPSALDVAPVGGVVEIFLPISDYRLLNEIFD